MKKKFVIPAAIAAAILLWYAFRPERLLVNQQVSESFPTATGTAQAATRSSALVLGAFQDGAHKTSGNAAVYEVEGGRRVLRLTNFATSNGPDVQVFLVADDGSNVATAVKKGDFVRLGSLKGNIGDQNYEIATNVDLAKYRAVSIWCNRFNVNFGAASLKPL